MIVFHPSNFINYIKKIPLVFSNSPFGKSFRVFAALS